MPRKSASASSVSAAAPAQAAAPVVSVVVETPAAPKVSRKPKAAAAVETAVAPAQPVVAKPAAKSASKSAAKPVAPAVEPVADVGSATAQAPVVETVVSLQSKLADFGSKIQEIGTLHSSLKTEYKLLEKTIAREMKQIAKSSGHKRHAVDASGNKQLCGFAKPSQISDELIAFLGKEPGTTMSRVEVSKEISNYVSANNLNDKNNGRIIHADAKLAKLLKLNDGDDLNYFNLQRYMKHHFIKATPVVASA